jgi:hypothetical protein
VGAEREAPDALLAHAKGVEAPALDLEARPAALVDNEVRADLVRVVLAEPLRPDMGAGFLIGGAHEEELASRAPALTRERDAGGGLRRDLVLHVLGATAAHLAAGDVSRPWGEAPLGGVGGDRVGVAEQAEGRAGLLAAKPGDQVRALGILGVEQLALEADLAEALGEQQLDRQLLVGRVGGIDPDQLAEEVDRLLAQPRLHPSRCHGGHTDSGGATVRQRRR